MTIEPQNRPFELPVLKRARAIAERYQIVAQFEDGEYYGCAVELPYIMNDGKTIDSCIRATRDSLVFAVATALERGERPPRAGRMKRKKGRSL